MFQENSFLDELKAGPLSAESRAYIGQRAKNEFYDFVLDKFRESGLSQVELARRIGGRTDSLNRLLRNPGNWRLETGAVLLAGICGEELLPSSKSFSERPPRNHQSVDDFDFAPLRRDDTPSGSSGLSPELTINLVRENEHEAA
jgi:hypothetical protein